MDFLEDPRLRQRWNRITHDAETVTENAAAGIWSFKQHYINPCFGYLGDSLEQCTALCLGDPDERLRRRRERQRSRAAAEYSFDFYDDWYGEQTGDTDGGGGGGGGGGGDRSAVGMFGSWAGEDWDRLLAGSGSQRKHLGVKGSTAAEQPRRSRGMSYGTRGGRLKSQHDPTIIPSTQPIGFLSKLPWKMGGTLRYKPSAADLQDHPGKHENPETEPLLTNQTGNNNDNDDDDESDYGQVILPRKRSGTAGSGGTGHTSDSFRSRGDLFPSDGEGEEDAVVLDDDVTYDMVRNDRSSSKSERTRSSKGKRPLGAAGNGGSYFASRTLSRTTIASNSSTDSMPMRQSMSSAAVSPGTAVVCSDLVASLHDLQEEGERQRQQEEKGEKNEKSARQKEADAQLAAIHSVTGSRSLMAMTNRDGQAPATGSAAQQLPSDTKSEAQSLPSSRKSSRQGSHAGQDEFVPARLPHFG